MLAYYTRPDELTAGERLVNWGIYTRSARLVETEHKKPKQSNAKKISGNITDLVFLTLPEAQTMSVREIIEWQRQKTSRN